MLLVIFGNVAGASMIAPPRAKQNSLEADQSQADKTDAWQSLISSENKHLCSSQANLSRKRK
jgi:hypothetical protein